MGGTFAWTFVVGIVAAGHPAGAAFALIVLLLLLAAIVYFVLVAVGIWWSAGRYKGKPAWAVLAKVAVAANASMLIMRVIYGVFGR